MLKTEQILESIVESIRSKRRWGPTFPTIFDLSCIVWNTEHSRIELDLLDNGKIRKFFLVLEELEHVEENNEIRTTNSN